MDQVGKVFVGTAPTVEGDQRDYGEDRFITIGFRDTGTVVMLRTPRDDALREWIGKYGAA